MRIRRFKKHRNVRRISRGLLKNTKNTKNVNFFSQILCGIDNEICLNAFGRGFDSSEVDERRF